MTSFTHDYTLSATSATIGPTASGSLLTVDFANTTGSTTDGTGTYSHSGQVVSPLIWGVATGAMTGNNGGQGGSSFSSGFTPLTYANFRAAMAKVPFTLYRINANSNIDSGPQLYTEACFGVGADSVGSVASPDFRPLANLINNASAFPATAKFVIGIGSIPSQSWTTTQYGQVCTAFVTYLHNNFPRTIIGWEVGNENVGDGSVGINITTYGNYFIAAADAIHKLYPNDLVIGPVATDSQIAAFNSFSAQCGSRTGAYCYHSYGDPAHSNFGAGTLGKTNASYTSATGVRGAVGGGSIPIMVGEWAMHANPVTTTDLPMTTHAGAIFAAEWMTMALNANSNVTMGAIWELTQDTDYGQISPNDNGSPLSQSPIPSTGTLNIVPCAWFLSKAGAVLYGSRVNAALVNTGNNLMIMAVKDGPANASTALLVVNYNTSTSYTGTIGLSSWPNTAGGGSCNLFRITSANNDGSNGTTTTVTVTNGVTQSLTIPPASISILYA